MFEVVIVKHGAMKWEWRVCNREGTFLMSGWGPTQAAPAICCVTHCPQKWEFLHHQFGVVDDGQPEFDGKGEVRRLHAHRYIPRQAAELVGKIVGDLE